MYYTNEYESNWIQYYYTTWLIHVPSKYKNIKNTQATVIVMIDESYETGNYDKALLLKMFSKANKTGLFDEIGDFLILSTYTNFYKSNMLLLPSSIWANDGLEILTLLAKSTCDSPFIMKQNIFQQ